LAKVVAYMDPEEFKTTWLANKAIYRTRMALADDAQLIVLAPGVEKFGEDERNDQIIRKYGYRTTEELMGHLEQDEELKDNLGALSHLIHGSSEGRFQVTYCPGHLTREEVEGVGYSFGCLEEMLSKYDITRLKDGFNTLSDGEVFFYISNPALGLWAYKGRFFDEDTAEEKEEVTGPGRKDEREKIMSSPKENKHSHLKRETDVNDDDRDGRIAGDQSTNKKKKFR